MRTPFVIGWLLVATMSVWAAPKPGTPPIDEEKRQSAKRFFDAGTLLFERGQFVDAAHEFERAYAEAPFAAFLYNIASAYDKGGDRPKAVEAYRKYAAAAPEAKDVGVARSRAEVLEREWKEIEAAKRGGAATNPKVPPPLPFVEPITKYSFQTAAEWDQKPFTLLGVGARKVYGFKVYAMALYVEDAPARQAFVRLAAQAGGSDHTTLLRGDLANQWLVMSEFGKVAVLHFVRKVSAKETRDAYREALGDTANSKAPPDLKRDAEAFLNLFDDVKEGENIVIRTSGKGEVVVEAHGQKKVGPTNLRLSHDIWDIWMGQKPISADLKKSLIDRIDTLGR
jgi:tetratricopeptide (TPR) repeat protein